jgi:hypothetical protein
MTSVHGVVARRAKPFIILPLCSRWQVAYRWARYERPLRWVYRDQIGTCVVSYRIRSVRIRTVRMVLAISVRYGMAVDTGCCAITGSAVSLQ